MIVIKLISCLLLAGVIQAQDYQDYQNSPRAAPSRLRPGNGPVDTRAPPTPVPILKQINRHNEDGSYTYGYEGADGSFKIETKIATGEVKGKYGYVDETGKVRVVEYGANKYGFQPSGEGITVAPPTLVDETTNKQGELIADYDESPQQIPQQKQFIARRPQQQPRVTRPQYSDYDEQPEPAPKPQYNPLPRQQFSAAPAPPRLQIPGAAPSDVVYSPSPRPARPDPEYSQSQTFSGHQQNAVRISRPSFAPPPSPVRPVSEPFQFPSARPVPQSTGYSAPSGPSAPSASLASQGRGTSSLLDQLARDYALPQGGSQALHDISFGYN